MHVVFVVTGVNHSLPNLLYVLHCIICARCIVYSPWLQVTHMYDTEGRKDARIKRKKYVPAPVLWVRFCGCVSLFTANSSVLTINGHESRGKESVQEAGENEKNGNN